MTEKITKLILACAASVALFSCASVPDGTFPQDGVYSYDFERYVDSVEFVYGCKVMGYDAYQNILKKSWGNAVYMQNGTFVEPETRIQISIAPNGDVSSPQNPSIYGKYKKNGDFFFQGYYEENTQIQKIVISAKLLPSPSSERASGAYDGDFVLTDNGTERKQNVKIEDGLYIWKYQEKQEDDFETWPVIVQSDGSINCGFDMTVRAGIKGMYDTLVSSRNESFGKVEPNGTIQMRTLTQNAGTGQSEISETLTFTGSRGTENFSQISKEQKGESEAIKVLTKAKNINRPAKKETPPEWYSDFIPNDADFIYGTAKKTHASAEAALKIAEITAASQIRTYLSHSVTQSSEAKKSMKKNDETKTESGFFRAIDSVSMIEIPYTVKNSFYDEKTETAYVTVTLARAEAEKLTGRKLYEK